VVLLVQVGYDGLSDSDEVVNIDEVGDVGVKVILEMLEHSHVILDILVSSDSWEGEGFVEKLVRVNWWKFYSKLSSNEDGVVVVLFIEMS